jgi:hypothetical protein
LAARGVSAMDAGRGGKPRARRIGIPPPDVSNFEQTTTDTCLYYPFRNVKAGIVDAIPGGTRKLAILALNYRDRQLGLLKSWAARRGLWPSRSSETIVRGREAPWQPMRPRRPQLCWTSPSRRSSRKSQHLHIIFGWREPSEGDHPKRIGCGPIERYEANRER